MVPRAVPRGVHRGVPREVPRVAPRVGSRVVFNPNPSPNPNQEARTRRGPSLWYAGAFLEWDVHMHVHEHMVYAWCAARCVSECR